MNNTKVIVTKDYIRVSTAGRSLSLRPSSPPHFVKIGFYRKASTCIGLLVTTGVENGLIGDSCKIHSTLPTLPANPRIILLVDYAFTNFF